MNLINELSSKIVAYMMLAIIGISIIWTVLSIILLPHRTEFMRWYMRTFSSHYKAADRIYCDLIRVCEESMKSHSSSRSSAYLEVYDYIINRPDIFRSSEETRNTNVVTAENFIYDELNACPEFENFVSFHGKGRHYHKVAIFFSFSNGINLKSIMFFYHEEYGINSYYRRIKERDFPSDDPGIIKAKRRKVLV